MRFFQWMLIAALALLLVACGGGGTPATPAAITPVINGAGQTLSARVNGTDISLSALEREVARQQVMLGAADMGALRAQVLNQMIEDALLVQGAAARNISVSDAELQTELQSNQQLAGNADAWAAWLSTNGYTADEYQQSLRTAMLSNRVRDTLAADMVGLVPQAHARHILLKTEAEAQDILKRLQNGEEFGGLAQQYSLDEISGEMGGDLGWFTADELFVPQVAQAVFALQVGQIAGPIGSELGYHIIQLLEKADLPVDPDRQVLITQQRFEAWLQGLYQQAVIERFM